MDDVVLARIEAQRSELEQNIAKLRKSLRHWQTLELDYEGLKEEFQGLPEDASRDECIEAGRDFKAVLVSEQDLQTLLKDTKVSNRTPQQLVETLSKRVEYVSRNVETIRKQLSEAERKRNALLLAEEPGHRDEAGLPLTEITEELDDSGQVISSRVETAKDSAPQLIEVLKKAGVSGLEDKNGTIKQMDDPSSEKATVGSTTNVSTQEDLESNRDQSSVSESSHTDNAAQSSEQSKNFSHPAHPYDSAEDAALRKEMLEYGLDEVGAIVAELDLEENASDVSYDEDEENLEIDPDFEDDFDDEDESEDETGRSKHPTISRSYRRRMEELQKKLGLQDMKNLGPTPNLPLDIQEQLDRPTPAEAARKAAIARHDAAHKRSSRDLDAEQDNSTQKEPKKKKKVAFAESLDIAKAESTDMQTPSTSVTSTEPKVNPVGDTVVERTEEQTPPPPPASLPIRSAKISRFKSAKQAATNAPAPVPDVTAHDSHKTTMPEPPQDRVISNTLIERTTPASASAPDPNEIDDEMHRREVAVEYHKLRNRKIHEQGGFVGDGEEDNYGDEVKFDPIEDLETGKTRKVSRFKAARLKS